MMTSSTESRCEGDIPSCICLFVLCTYTQWGIPGLIFGCGFYNERMKGTRDLTVMLKMWGLVDRGGLGMRTFFIASS